jgi:hypothetical protein
MICFVSWATRWHYIQRCKRKYTRWTFAPFTQLIVLIVRLANELLSQVSQQPTLRDELAVQICSQLINNPNPESSARGWDFLEKVQQFFFVVMSCIRV